MDNNNSMSAKLEASIKVPFNLARSVRFWTRQTLSQCGDKGGSFNMDLYMRYLEAISKQ